MNPVYEKSINYRKTYPWFRPWEYAKRRCNDPKHRSYRWYGGRGIKCTLTREQVIFLFERDKGWNLEEPSLDRIDDNGDYFLENCRFIELWDNVNKGKGIKNEEENIKEAEWTD